MQYVANVIICCEVITFLAFTRFSCNCKVLVVAPRSAQPGHPCMNIGEDEECSATQWAQLCIGQPNVLTLRVMTCKFNKAVALKVNEKG